MVHARLPIPGGRLGAHPWEQVLGCQGLTTPIACEASILDGVLAGFRAGGTEGRGASWLASRSTEAGL